MASEEPSTPNPGDVQQEGAGRRKEKKKRMKGFAGMVGNMLLAANDSQRFKERYAGASITIAIIAEDYLPGALITIDDGTIAVAELAREDLKTTKRDALIQGKKMDDIMAIAMGKVNPVGLWITRKVKLRGLSKLMDLARAFYYAMKQQKAGAPSSSKPST